MNQPRGTFECPICGQDAPHGHEDSVVAAYRDDQVRQDGWTSSLLGFPKVSGWYLARGHKIDGSPLYSGAVFARQAFSDMPAEVLKFDRIYGWEVPLSVSDRFGIFRRVTVMPTHWRTLPGFNAFDAALSDGGRPR